MRVNYIDNNSIIVPDREPMFTADNRGFRYGDGLIETMRWMDGQIRFLDRHVARLQEGLRLLQMERPEKFDSAFISERANGLIRKNGLEDQHVRVRMQVYRAGGGLYSPNQNNTGYVMHVAQVDPDDVRHRKLGLIVDVYSDIRKPYSALSGLKSANALVYVMAGLYRKQKDLDDVIVLNQEGFVCESLSANLFFWYDGKLYTPALSEGCINGVMRGVVIEMALARGMEVVEAQISPDIMQEADEIFCTNAVQGVQWVMGYKQKRYFNRISRILQEELAIYSPIA